MSYISPLNLLLQQKAIYESAIRHSDEALSKGLVSVEMNKQHHKNNKKFIREYNNTIKKLIFANEIYDIKRRTHLKSKFNKP